VPRFEATTYGFESECATHYTTGPDCHNTLLVFIVEELVNEQEEFDDEVKSDKGDQNPEHRDMTDTILEIWQRFAHLDPEEHRYNCKHIDTIIGLQIQVIQYWIRCSVESIFLNSVLARDDQYDMLQRI